MCDGHENSTKTKSSDTYSSKMLYTQSALYFWPQNSHFSITWFKRVIFDPFLTPRGEGLNLTKHFLAEIERSRQYASNEVQITFYEAF